jgi:hypothetical protein
MSTYPISCADVLGVCVCVSLWLRILDSISLEPRYVSCRPLLPLGHILTSPLCCVVLRRRTTGWCQLYAIRLAARATTYISDGMAWHPEGLLPIDPARHNNGNKDVVAASHCCASFLLIPHIYNITTSLSLPPSAIVHRHHELHAWSVQ